MKKFSTSIFFYFALMILLVVGVSAQFTPSRFVIDDNTTLWDVMSKLGKIKPNLVDKNTLHSIDKGKELISQASSIDFNGKKTAKTGAFPCLACHSTQKEFDQLQVFDATKRLDYADSLGLPFLPGTPFYGLVNRIYYFNNDFQKDSFLLNTTFKQKDLFKRAHTDLRTAIQNCNQTYAHGRVLADWEVESILAYLWTLQIYMKDLDIAEKDMQDIQFSLDNNTGNAKAVNLLRRYYLETYPATLEKPLHVAERRKTSPILNNFFNGEKLYDHSCLHCHQNKAYANKQLDKSESSFQFLKKHFDDSTSAHSVYESHRFLHVPKRALKNSKAPHFTKERLASQQLQDLRFYITQMLQFGEEAREYYKPKAPRTPAPAPIEKIESESDTLKNVANAIPTNIAPISDSITTDSIVTATTNPPVESTPTAEENKEEKQEEYKENSNTAQE